MKLMTEINLQDPIKQTLKSIVDITYSIVSDYRRRGKDYEARELILWVANCLHKILVKKEKLYKENPFTPELVMSRYYIAKDRAALKHKNVK